MEWISVRDKKPEKYFRVILWLDTEEWASGYYTEEIIRHSLQEKWFDEKDERVFSTHWYEVTEP